VAGRLGCCSLISNFCGEPGEGSRASASASTRTMSRPKLTSHGWSARPELAAAMSSTAATRSDSSGSGGVAGMTDRPAAPQTNRLYPDAASGASSAIVVVEEAPPSCPSTRCVTSPAPATAATEVTGPRQAQSMPTRCGPRSQRAPFPCRHGVLKGESGCSAVPSQTAVPPDQPSPDQPPRACSSASQARISRLNRQVKKTTEATPAFWTAAATASASSAQSAIGFSSSRCLPASAARIASGACTSGGTANATASTLSRNSPKSWWRTAPYLAASAEVAFAFRPQTAVSVAPGVVASAGACVKLAQ
jgi:hypothetical protein